jgi:hypothetical protein
MVFLDFVFRLGIDKDADGGALSGSAAIIIIERDFIALLAWSFLKKSYHCGFNGDTIRVQ